MESDSTLDTAASLRWLDTSPPACAVGARWGVPWPQGHLTPRTALALTDANGASIPTQSWPLAFWPDGTLKWTGHAALASPALDAPLILAPGTPAVPSSPVRIDHAPGTLTVTNGAMVCRIAERGPYLIDTLALDGQVVAHQGRLVCLREDRSALAEAQITREEEFGSRVETVTVEQAGPVLAVVKLQGTHLAQGGERAWLPFTVRLYFTAGTDTVRLVHSFVFDGDPETDFIKGLGVRFDVPLREERHNRHVRLAGDSGLFAEPVQVIAGRRNPDPALYARQVTGARVPDLSALPAPESARKMAAWNDWKLTQLADSAYAVHKRTGAHSAWIAAPGGGRSLGLVFAGDVSGGLALGMTNFWQLCPTALQVDGAATETAQVTVWLWSPDAPAMDLRHYDIEEHGLHESYEDIDAGHSTAHGVARTTELYFQPFGSVPASADLLALAQAGACPPRLVCTPERYHAVRAFGIWSLPTRASTLTAWLEDQLDDAVLFYQTQIAQRHWFGFWDYGDVMHSYDAARHEWRYDIGGFAWANSELVPDLWLWYMFLRTGRADLFRMAEAMTRHTQEVDVYHQGPLAGLGSRHNVRHWGCGAKEARVSQALLKRPFYYLTADERTGDLMTEVADADFATIAIDPLRKIEPKTQYPTHARVGPDWFAFCSNWLAAWERTGSVHWRDKIQTGMRCLAAMPHKLFSGESYGYDPQTGMLYQLHSAVDVPHLAALMGGPQLCMELGPLIADPAWDDAWLHYCRLLQAPPDTQMQTLGAVYHNGRGPHFACMTAYAAAQTHDPALARRAWAEFLRDTAGRSLFAAETVSGPVVPGPVSENRRVSTNDAAQWCLNAIQLLELIGDSLPAQGLSL